jgi:hypothetical protein
MLLFPFVVSWLLVPAIRVCAEMKLVDKQSVEKLAQSTVTQLRGCSQLFQRVGDAIVVSQQNDSEKGIDLKAKPKFVKASSLLYA